MSAIKTILTAGLVAGVLDAGDAVVVSLLRGGSAETMFQYIASGVLGRASFKGGVATSILGLLLHFFIATSAATVFFLAAARLRDLTRRPLLWGTLFGIAVYIFVNYLVVPLSAVPKGRRPPDLSLITNGVLASILLVGVPIAWITARKTNRP